MKISNLTIKNYKQFKDLTLDLTYPKGHEKEGQPLDKICIIGQSGTGKTNLLDIIKKSTVDFRGYKNTYKPFNEFVGKKSDNQYIINQFVNKNNIDIKMLFSSQKNEIESSLNDDEKLLAENEKSYFLGVKIDSLSSFLGDDFKNINMSEEDTLAYQNLLRKKRYLNVTSNIGKSTLYKFGFSALSNSYDEENENLKIVNDQIKELEVKYKTGSKNISLYLKKMEEKKHLNKYIIDVNNGESWEVLKEKIDRYKENEQLQQTLLFNKIMNDESFSKEDSINEMKDWQEKNTNIIKNISDDINLILKKFNLKLTKIDENQKDFNSLTIKDLSNDSILEYDDLSTGTKNLLSTFIPLKSYSPQDSIILIDEPEMSFYPDIQKKLVDLYTDVGENNQLILATHSPIIASSFEPWEVVELKFDDNNQIYRELYFNKDDENHVKNYTLDPRMLTWTGILMDIFDLKDDSNFSIREKALMEYATLKAEIKMIEDTKEKEAKFKDLQKLSKKLGLDN